MNKICGLMLLLIVNYSSASKWQNSDEIKMLFQDAGVVGTFVVYDVTADKLIGHARARAETRYIPASTFKVPHSLIGLSVGAVKDVNEILPFGGKPQPFKSWEQDMSLRDAIKISNVPIYQELARRITLPRMKKELGKIQYGNGKIGDVVDNFWLVGPLEISALEQVKFLAQLAQGELPFSEAVQQQVRSITLLEQQDDWVLHGKTGWASVSEPGVGWWVGWVVKQDKIYSFALNLDVVTASDAEKRIELGKASLKLLGIF